MGIPDKLELWVDGLRGGVPQSIASSAMGDQMMADRGDFLFPISTHLLFIRFVVGHGILPMAIGAGRVGQRWARLGCHQLTPSVLKSEIFLEFCNRVIKIH